MSTIKGNLKTDTRNKENLQAKDLEANNKKYAEENKRKEPAWQYKPIVLKKSKPDPVLTSFFTVVKSKKAINHHNHQGFPKKQCWFATNLDDYYYVNPEYVENFPMVVKMYREDGVYFPCRHCKLGPCVRVGIRWLIVKYCEETLENFKNAGPEELIAMRHETEKMMCFTMGQAFGKPQYTCPIYSKEPAPECTRNFILNYFLKARPELKDGAPKSSQFELPHDDEMFESDYTRPESKRKKESVEPFQPLLDDDRTIHSDEFEHEPTFPDGVFSREQNGSAGDQVEGSQNPPKEICLQPTEAQLPNDEESDAEFEFQG